MKIVKLTPFNQQEVIAQTVAVLKSGNLVVFPSDTVYGLLADAQNPKAVTKLLQFKERRPGQAISVFVTDKKMAEKYVRLNQNGLNVVNNLLPGPFTVVAESRHQTDPRLEAENGTLGIRIPDYPLILKLVAAFGHPLTATSANLSGQPPNHSIAQLLNYLSETKKALVDLIVDAGKLPRHKPSTVIDTTTGQLKTLRIGELLPKSPNLLVSNSESQTKHLAQFIASKIIRKTAGRVIIFLLEGPLGVGKTVFAKGLGKALGVQEEITSPTFTICNEYDIPLSQNDNFLMSNYDTEKQSRNISKFIHCDLFRLETKEEFEELHFFENLDCGNIYAIEWPERLPAEIISALKTPAEIVLVKLRYLSPAKREIEWGKSAKKRVKF